MRRWYFGLLLCVLTVFFSVTAKAALYQPGHQEAKGITSTKIWQDDATRSEEGRPVIALVPVVLATLLLTPSYSSTTVFLLSPDDHHVSKHAWFASSLFVRPPPSL
jgi:hypothetical protein